MMMLDILTKVGQSQCGFYERKQAPVNGIKSQSLSVVRTVSHWHWLKKTVMIIALTGDIIIIIIIIYEHRS